MNNKNISKLLIVALTSFMIVGCQRGNDQSNSKKSEDTQIPSKTSGDTAHNSSDSGGEIIDKIVEDPHEQSAVRAYFQTVYRTVEHDLSAGGCIVVVVMDDGFLQHRYKVQHILLRLAAAGYHL